MSFDSITRKANTKGDIKYLSTSTGAGGQLTKSWKMRYHDVMGRLVSLKSKKEALYYDKQKVFAEFMWVIPYKSGILTTDRVYIGSRVFLIKFVRDWDEQKKHLLIALQEYKND